MASGTEIERVEALIEPVVQAAGLVLYDVELTTTHRRRVLRVAVDRPRGTEPSEGVQLEELVALNRELSAVFDMEDPISGRYRLDVESPGVERRLRRARHFTQAVGEKVKIVLNRTLSDGNTVVEGVLVAAEGDDATQQADVRVQKASGDVVELSLLDIKKANTLFDWDKARAARKKVTDVGASPDKATE